MIRQFFDNNIYNRNLCNPANLLKLFNRSVNLIIMIIFRYRLMRTPIECDLRTGFSYTGFYQCNARVNATLCVRGGTMTKCRRGCVGKAVRSTWRCQSKTQRECSVGDTMIGGATLVDGEPCQRWWCSDGGASYRHREMVSGRVVVGLVVGGWTTTVQPCSVGPVG